MIVNLKKILEDAEKNSYAVALFVKLVFALILTFVSQTSSFKGR